MESQKPIHTLVLDTGAIIKNEPPVSTLLSQSESLVTVPAIISEIKDAATRSRVETTLSSFLTIRSPNPTSLKFVTDFARRTGDLAVLSKADIQIIALTYEIECERNGGDWRLRRLPGQKGVNGAPPQRSQGGDPNEDASKQSEPSQEAAPPREAPTLPVESSPGILPSSHGRIDDSHDDSLPVVETSDEKDRATSLTDARSPHCRDITDSISQLHLEREQRLSGPNGDPKVDTATMSAKDQLASDSDSEGWITPSNLKRRQAEAAGASTTQSPEPKVMQVAVLTTDFAMQNVILQINLNLLSPSLTRVKHLKTFVLRCHACFQVTKAMSKQFCPRCGQPSLTRVSCSTNANGEFKLHLKKNMQWNSRGDRYSIPKPVHGSANGRVHGGGKGSWGNDLILAEDQKEYQRAARDETKQKERNLMDEDYLPSILTGDRGKTGGKIKVGAGRTVNSRKR